MPPTPEDRRQTRALEEIAQHMKAMVRTMVAIQNTLGASALDLSKLLEKASENKEA